MTIINYYSMYLIVISLIFNKFWLRIFPEQQLFFLANKYFILGKFVFNLMVAPCLLANFKYPCHIYVSYVLNSEQKFNHKFFSMINDFDCDLSCSPNTWRSSLEDGTSHNGFWVIILIVGKRLHLPTPAYWHIRP